MHGCANKLNPINSKNVIWTLSILGLEGVLFYTVNILLPKREEYDIIHEERELVAMGAV